MKTQSPCPAVHIETWGCQMNVADSERMLALLSRHGFRAVAAAEEADLIILNTCNIREKARHKVLTRLGALRQYKLEKPGLVLALAGCIAQVEADSLAKELPFLDLIFGPDHIEELPSLLEKLQPEKQVKPHVETTFSESGDYSISLDEAEPWIEGSKFEPSRFVNIIKGCNNFCSYCVVPYTRGREKSRPYEEIAQEIRLLLDRGIKEIVLLGQNVNSYGLDLLSDRDGASRSPRTPFVELLYRVAAIEGLSRLRFVTANPHDFSPMLPQAYADIPILTDQLHLPVQSGSNEVLRAMNRKYTREEYLAKVHALREVRPEIALSTDLIVGFPGETTQDFEQTLSLMREARFSSLFAFKYSPRPLTEAARFPDAVDEAEKDRRLQMVLDVQKEETLRQNRTEVGRTRECLVVYKSSRQDRTWYGRTFAGRLVKILDIDSEPGASVSVRITSANAISLEGVRA